MRATVSPYDAAAQGGAAFPGLVRHDHREALILGAGPERRLAASRVPDDRDACGIDARVGHEVVHRPARAPRPCRDRAPRVGRRLPAARAVEQRHRARAERVLVVRRELPVVERGDAVAARDELLRRPEPGFLRPCRVGERGRPIVDEQEHRRAARRVRQEERQLELVRSLRLAADDPDAPQRGRAVHGARVLLEHREGEMLRLSGRSAVHGVAEEAEDLLAARCPLRRRPDRTVSRPPARSGSVYRRHARLLVVRVRAVAPPPGRRGRGWRASRRPARGRGGAGRGRRSSTQSSARPMVVYWTSFAVEFVSCAFACCLLLRCCWPPPSPGPLGAARQAASAGHREHEFIYEQRAVSAGPRLDAGRDDVGPAVAAWFGGTEEGDPDVSIWVARLEKRPLVARREGRRRRAGRDEAPPDLEPRALPAARRPAHAVLQGRAQPA